MVANSSILVNRRKEQLAINVNKKIVRHAYRCLTIFSWCSLADLCKFWFSNADQMISISAFRFPARSGFVIFRSFFRSKNRHFTKISIWSKFWQFLLIFLEFYSILGWLLAQIQGFFADFCRFFPDQNFNWILRVSQRKK